MRAAVGGGESERRAEVGCCGEGVATELERDVSGDMMAGSRGAIRAFSASLGLLYGEEGLLVDWRRTSGNGGPEWPTPWILSL